MRGTGGTSACSRCLGSTASRLALARCGTCSIHCYARWNCEQSSRCVAASNRKELTGAVPDLGTCRMLDISSSPLRERGVNAKQTYDSNCEV